MAPRSAFVGQPPATADDRTIVQGMFLIYGVDDGNLSRGIDIEMDVPPLPHDNQQGRIIAACAIGLIIMVTSTTLRLSIRVMNKSLSWGMDDWNIIFATVSRLHLDEYVWDRSKLTFGANTSYSPCSPLSSCSTGSSMAALENISTMSRIGTLQTSGRYAISSLSVSSPSIPRQTTRHLHAEDEDMGPIEE